MEIIPKEPGAEQLIYQGAAELVTLRGQSGAVMVLPFGTEKVVQWLPTDRRAVDLEVRFGVVNWRFPEGVPVVADPEIRWQVEWGHGNTMWVYPQRSYPNFTARELIQRPYLPARGQVLRLPARELTLRLNFVGMLSVSPVVTPWIEASIGVSFQPVIGMQKPSMTSQSFFIHPSEPLNVRHNQFPADATEWRLYDQYGLPFVAGENEDVRFYNIAGATLGTSASFKDRAAYADWTPISPRYLTWTLASVAAEGEMFGASYR